jgi:hypothetical protein
MGLRPTFLRTSLMAMAPNLMAETFFKEAPNVPMAVLDPLTMTTSLI